MKIQSLAYNSDYDDPKKARKPGAVRPAPSPSGLSVGGGGSSSGGTTINSTNGQLPYRVNGTTFGNSAFASNALNSTYLQATSGASGAGLTLAVAGGGAKESLTAALKGDGQLVLSNSGYNASAPLLVRSGSLNGGIDFSSGGIFFITSGTAQAAVSTSGLIIKSSIQYGHTSGNADAADIDTGWARFAAGVHRATNGSTGAGQLLIGTSTDTVSAQLDVRSQSTTRPAGRFQAASGAASTQINIENRNGSGNITGGFYVSGVLLTGVFTVATLPSAASCGAGARAFVTDANSSVFASAAVGGGILSVPVFSDGTNWLIG